MDDETVGAWLAARRKMIVGVLAFAAVLVAGELVPADVQLYVQAMFAFLGVYGIHEVAND